MEYTSEQTLVHKHEGNGVIIAVAGSGKTTTLLTYAQSRPNKRFLFLCFNKSVKDEVNLKLAVLKITNVEAHTAHSLAYGPMRSKFKFKAANSEISLVDLGTLLKFPAHKDVPTRLALLKQVQNLTSFYNNSLFREVSQCNYIDTLSDKAMRELVSKHWDDLVYYSRMYLVSMANNKIEVTHDFYLKQFQLSKPVLAGYDYILFDEGQDASPTMLDIFLSQSKPNKLIVGDPSQQIYSFRYAINSLAQVDFPTFHLTNSFRFDSNIAALANETLKMKLPFGITAPKINGVGKSPDSIASKAILGRSNLVLFKEAIYAVQGKPNVRMFFEGNFSSYAFADSGSSIWDVLNLYLGKKDLIRHSLIKSFNNFNKLKEFVEQSSDKSLLMLVQLVEEFSGELPHLVNQVKTVQVPSKSMAELVLSTVHKCKGMEYDSVRLCEGFVDDTDIDALEKSFRDDDDGIKQMESLMEEINILYVAITRSKGKIALPAALQFLNEKAGIKNQQEVVNQTLDQSSTTPQVRTWGHYEILNLKFLLGQPIKIEEIARRLCRPVKEIAEYIKQHPSG